MSRPDLNPALEFLHCPTPDAWLAAVPAHLDVLLIDHANCEKKAASTAVSLLYKYIDQPELLDKMSRLAREELRHFEQVLELMRSEQINYTYLSPARYAQQLHSLVRKQEPGKLVDLLILGAVVEARSCERFVRLLEILPQRIGGLYRQLVHSEARHFQDYLSLAQSIAQENIDDRIESFLGEDANLVTKPDPEFRFHSGVPG
jgi:tRNA-(ms[2]io[6]A)-hydroxylase